MDQRTVDPEKLRAALRKMTRGDLLILLDRAIAHLPNAQLDALFEDVIPFDALASTGKQKLSLLDEVKVFHEASLRGVYYDDFDVNSKNYMDLSPGTENWIAECTRLLDGAIELSEAGDAAETGQAFELVFDLLRRIDRCEDDIIFFADEPGSWQVGIDWVKVLPAWFRCLAATAEPEEYTLLVDDVINDFVRPEGPKYLAKARAAATPEQQAALARTTDPKEARRR
jgi:hypothetical protein